MIIIDTINKVFNKNKDSYTVKVRFNTNNKTREFVVEKKDMDFFDFDGNKYFSFEYDG